MSGGHFDYKQYQIQYIIDELKELLNKIETPEKCCEEESNGVGCECYNLSDAVIKDIKNLIPLLKEAKIKVNRLDYLLCEDDSEDTYFERLKEELKTLKK